MQIEYEATFTEIDKDEMRKILEAAGASLERAEFMQRRSVYHLPDGHAIDGGWARVRDEGDKITVSLKIVDGDKIEDQKEACVVVNSFVEADKLLQALGCKKKAYQETKRELWLIDDVEVTIDTWPFLEPFVEVEGDSEEKVKAVSEKLGFEWNDAKFCAVDVLYNEKYGTPADVINNHTPKIMFDMENPFLDK